MRDVHMAVVAAVIGGLALVAAPAVVSAEPFTRAELDEALRLRVDARHAVTVAAGETSIVVTVDGRSRTVQLDGERGADAARVVALVAAALAVESDAARRDRDDAALGDEVRVQPAARAAGPARWGVGM